MQAVLAAIWTHVLPTVDAGEPADADTFVADAGLPRDPHTLRLTLSAAQQTVLGVWLTRPGHPHSLIEIRRPWPPTDFVPAACMNGRR